VGDDITTTVLTDDEIDPGLLVAARDICSATFGERFSGDDWDHTLGGVRLLLFDEGLLVGHAAVVPRTVGFGKLTLRAGYVEGVAVLPQSQGCGLGSRLVRAVNTIIERDGSDVGVLSTSRRSFYARLGWEPWQGPSFVRYADGLVRTPDEDDGLMVLRVGTTPNLVPTWPITCDARCGDDW
jgi:aminoglycoside 2'-N-acetyltransferase I